jgi:acetyl esterase/lipase
MAFVLAEYQALVAKVGAENITIMGDSAGGGMSLALAEKLNVVDTPQPAHLILLSPWMDVRMTNPEIIETDKLDPVLGVQGAMCAGIMYAGAHDLKDFEVSPLFGNIKNLAPITLFIGSHDILEPDCRLFKQKAEAENIKLDYRLYKNMVHVWMVISGLPEANQAIDEIVEVLKQ